MKRATLIPIICSIALCTLTPLRVSGQTTGTTATPTPTPSPTPTATPSMLPAASVLLAQMQQAMAKMKSFRLVEDAVSIATGVTITFHTVTDAATRPLRIHEVLTVKASGTANGQTQNRSTKYTLIVLRKQAAMRHGKKAWKCQSLASVSGSAGVAATTRVAQFQNPITVGGDTVRGIAVWHLHADITEDLSTAGSAFAGQILTIPTEIYIAQSNHRMIRIAGTADTTISGIALHLSLTDDFSHFGETVKVKLPAACRKNS